MMTRAEHLQWCKDRALEYAAKGETANAVASMGSDLSKHPETDGHAGIQLGAGLLMIGALSRHHELVDWIEGFW